MISFRAIEGTPAATPAREDPCFEWKKGRQAQQQAVLPHFKVTKPLYSKQKVVNDDSSNLSSLSSDDEPKIKSKSLSPSPLS